MSACSADPRFPPVTVRELPDLTIELSLLGPLTRITTSEEVTIGLHGLIVERRPPSRPAAAAGRHRMAVDRETLAETCPRPGCPGRLKHGALVWRFEAEVFGD